MIKYDFTDKVAIVTGAARGLGRAISAEFAKAGAKVVMTDMDLDELQTAATEIENECGRAVDYAELDVTNYEAFSKLTAKVRDDYGRIDILVNNAGICTLMPLTDMPVETCDKMIQVNLNGTFYGCKAVLPIMREQKYGKIVNLSSIAAKLGNAGTAVYAATKAGVLELTACLAREYARDGINVNCVLPGIIRTPLWEHMLEEMTGGTDQDAKDATFENYTDDIPMGVPQEPIDIANAVLFLCTDEARYITAQNLGIDGGQTY